MAKGKVHVNEKGEPGVCSADKRDCPFGLSDEEHYETFADARAGYEKLMEAKVEAQERAERLAKSVRSIADVDKKLESTARSKQKVMATIQPKLDLLEAQREVQNAERNITLSKIFDSTTLDDLSDPATAGVIYNLGWDGGRGGYGIIGTDFGAMSRELLKNSYVTMEIWESNSDRSQIVPMLTIHGDDAEDEAKLAQTAALLEKLYPTQRKLVPQISVDFIGSKYDATMERNEESGLWEYKSGLSSYPDFTASNAREVLDYGLKEIKEDRAMGIDDWN